MRHYAVPALHGLIDDQRMKPLQLLTNILNELDFGLINILTEFNCFHENIHGIFTCLLLMFSSIMICRPAMKHRGANRYFSWMWRWRELILACDRLINKMWTRTIGERYIPAPSPRWRSLWERQFHTQLSQSFTHCRLHSGAWNILWHLRL